MGAKNISNIEADGAVKQVITVIAAIILTVIVLGGFYVIGNKVTGNDSAANEESQFVEEYQAVFLSNGQVYFGQIVSKDDQELELVDIYYLQINRPLQATSEEGEDVAQVAEETPATSSGITLVKLGSEIHGPTDRMVINMDQVMFIEDLRDDSRVVEAIKNESL